MQLKNIAILASGNGSNADNIARFFATSSEVNVSVVLSNNEKAGVHSRMKELGVPSVVFNKEDWREATAIVDFLNERNIDLIVLAGFMSMIHQPITTAFAGRIINIHPSLLPKFGGKGMWGMNVHNAVVEAGEIESGITIHYVNEEIDCGDIITQHRCSISPDDTAEIVAQKVHELEYQYFPITILEVLRKFQ